MGRTVCSLLLTYLQRIARLIASLFLTTTLDNTRLLHPHIIRIRHIRRIRRIMCILAHVTSR